MKTYQDFKNGEKVRLVCTGSTYSCIRSKSNNYLLKIFFKLIFSYVNRYRPCNVNKMILPSLVSENSMIYLKIRSGYKTKEDLALDKNLTWKIKLIYPMSDYFAYFIISSNKNHLLIANDDAIEKIQTK